MAASFLDPGEPAMSPVDAGEALLVYGISIAEGKVEEIDASSFRFAYRRLMADPAAQQVASGLLRRLTTPDLLWSHLKSVATGSGSWALRRDAVHGLLDPVLDAIVRIEHPADALVTDAAARLNAESVRDAWKRALARRDPEPEGAVTMART